MASASEAMDDFVSRARTDVAIDRYEAGELGVLLPSHERIYLYAAWRAIVL
ncbi:MAG: hypothetical protein MO853_10135 [Candidatus Protistobacter heckmanni]|nr:hypothetical protein [Candidatus Protistobacter heckmanni]